MYVSGTKLDDRIIRIDWDVGFSDGRQFGRGRSGGQVRTGCGIYRMSKASPTLVMEIAISRYILSARTIRQCAHAVTDVVACFI